MEGRGDGKSAVDKGDMPGARPGGGIDGAIIGVGSGEDAFSAHKMTSWLEQDAKHTTAGGVTRHDARGGEDRLG